VSTAAGVETTDLAPKERFETTSRDAYYTRRHELVLRHFPTALGVDDFMSRVEIALSAHGFRGDNSIGARLLVWLFGVGLGLGGVVV
jgi:hypothetical protein